MSWTNAARSALMARTHGRDLGLRAVENSQDQMPYASEGGLPRAKILRMPGGSEE